MTTPDKDAHTAPGGADHFADVGNMVARLRHFNAWRRDHNGELEQPSPRQIGADIDAACDALKSLAREVDQLRRLTSGDAREFMQGLVDECSREIVRRRDAESRLAKLAPVVEAARKWRDEVQKPTSPDAMFFVIGGLIEALATPEAAHD